MNLYEEMEVVMDADHESSKVTLGEMKLDYMTK